MFPRIDPKMLFLDQVGLVCLDRREGNSIHTQDKFLEANYALNKVDSTFRVQRISLLSLMSCSDESAPAENTQKHEMG